MNKFIGIILALLLPHESLSFVPRPRPMGITRAPPLRAASGTKVGEHTVMTIPPVRALMLSTTWKNDAENMRALGYTPIDTTFTIVQKSSAADMFAVMQRWANQLTLLSKMENPKLPGDHPLKDALEGLEILCSISSRSGNALAFYKRDAFNAGEAGERRVVIEACLGNLALGNNEVAEEALVRRIIDEAKDSRASTVECFARVAPSGSTYLPTYYDKLGFKAAKPQAEIQAEDVKEAEIGWGGAEKTGQEKIGWGGMWVEADTSEALRFVLKLE
mmetsp:Transcript_21320/g.48089  ORF Transcript_21320/g.48089 Transcript_21320/m.48089 type:complete len:275 (-) Transcript_21320:12-836(-)